MKREGAFTLKVLGICLLVVGALVAAYLFAALDTLGDIARRVNSLAGEPERVPQGLSDLGARLAEIRQYLLPAVLVPGALAALILWLVIHGLSRRSLKRVATSARVEAPEAETPAASPASAVQILSILQRRGRLIDFLQEDLAAYSDEQVGAAVRNIHQGCKEALLDHVELQPILKEDEGAEVTIPPGFDIRSVRLTGNVVGDPPFRGILRHHGWRVARVNLPQQMREQEKSWVVDPAEVDVNPA